MALTTPHTSLLGPHPAAPQGSVTPALAGALASLTAAGAEHASAVAAATADEERIRKVLQRAAVIRADTARIQQSGVVQSPAPLSSAMEPPPVLPETGPLRNIAPVSPHGTPINFSVITTKKAPVPLWYHF